MRTAHTLGRLVKQPDGTWKLESISTYSDGVYSITTDFMRHRYVEILPPATGRDYEAACKAAREQFAREARFFAGVDCSAMEEP